MVYAWRVHAEKLNGTKAKEYRDRYAMKEDLKSRMGENGMASSEDGICRSHQWNVMKVQQKGGDYGVKRRWSLSSFCLWSMYVCVAFVYVQSGVRVEIEGWMGKDDEQALHIQCSTKKPHMTINRPIRAEFTSIKHALLVFTTGDNMVIIDQWIGKGGGSRY